MIKQQIFEQMEAENLARNFVCSEIYPNGQNKRHKYTGNITNYQNKIQQILQAVSKI